MRRAVLVSAGLLTAPIAFAVTFTLAQSDGGAKRTPGHGLEPRETECVVVVTSDAPGGATGAASAREALDRGFPEESKSDLTEQWLAPDQVVFEKYLNGKKVAGYRARKSGDTWFVMDAEVLTTNCPDQPGFRGDIGPGQLHE